MRVRVTTTDGWNTASAESGSFAIGGQLTDGLVVVQRLGHGDVWTVGMDGSGAKKIDDERPPPALVARRPQARVGRHGPVHAPTPTAATCARSRTPAAELHGPAVGADGDKMLAEHEAPTRRATSLVDAETGAETPFADAATGAVRLHRATARSCSAARASRQDSFAL